MKAGIFDPYLDTIGGGEVYSATVAECLLKANFEVDLFWQDHSITDKLHKFLGIDLSAAKLNPLGFTLYKSKGNWLQKKKLSLEYDFIFYLSDGSIPWLFSKRNIIHFQIPFTNVNGSSFSNRLKFNNIHRIICNSLFTKLVVDEEYKVSSSVVYPPINIKTKTKKKQNIILSVGRFTDTLHRKRQDILITSFKSLVDEGLEGWKLKLIGSSKEGKQMIKDLSSLAKNYPIEIVADISHDNLEDEYSKARIFWHAAGFGINQKKNPELAEHFGIATVEAMSAGCVPIVINKGGQPEIVKNAKNGFLWNDTQQLKAHTIKLIGSKEIQTKLAKEAIKDSKKFSKNRFCKNIIKLTKI